MSKAGFPDRFGVAVNACASDLGVPAERIHVHAVRPQYKSLLLFLGTAEPRYALKIEPAGSHSDWNPEREKRGLQFIEERFAGSSDFSFIPLVEQGSDPKFVLTRYVAGRSGRGPFDRAALLPWPSRAAKSASALTIGCARWLARFRGDGEADTEVNAAGLLAVFTERIAEIGDSAHDWQERITALATEVLDRPEAGELLGRRFPTHGDFGPQNLYPRDDGRLVILDLEGFAMRPLNNDLAKFRVRLEHYAIRGPLARHRCERLWRDFIGALDQEPGNALFGYLHWLLAHLAWLRASSSSNLTTRVREALWIRQRLRWLNHLPARADAAIETFASSL